MVHPRGYGSYPRILGRYVRDEKLLTLEDAVRRMTGGVAARLGLRDRGLLREGMFADVVVFDDATIIDLSTPLDAMAAPPRSPTTGSAAMPAYRGANERRTTHERNDRRHDGDGTPRRHGSQHMQRVMVRYTVKPGRAAENERYMQEVFAELARTAPAGMQYATFKLDDGVTFVHVYSHESANGVSPLPELPAFQAFRAGLAERCEVAPVRTPLHEVGSYSGLYVT
ncbi:MAG: amidohydrolase family protein [Gemmatimonadaceae bacterium]